MLATERGYETNLRDFVDKSFDKLGVQIESLVERPHGVIDMVLRLPAWADRATRHDAVRVLSDFEASVNHEVSTSAAFAWGEPDEDA